MMSLAKTLSIRPMSDCVAHDFAARIRFRNVVGNVSMGWLLRTWRNAAPTHIRLAIGKRDKRNRESIMTLDQESEGMQYSRKPTAIRLASRIVVAAMICLTTTWARTDEKNPVSRDDARIRDYKRKIAAVDQRVAAAEKAVRQATVDYKDQVDRKQRELQELLKDYQQRAASAKKAIGQLRKEQAGLAQALGEYQPEGQRSQELLHRTHHYKNPPLLRPSTGLDLIGLQILSISTRAKFRHFQ